MTDENKFHKVSDQQAESEELREESFADLFEACSSEMPSTIRIGDRIKGKIISIGRDFAFVDTGTKTDGAVELNELKNEEGELPYQTGDRLTLYVVAKTESEIRLSCAMSSDGGEQQLQEAYENEIPVQGKVSKAVKGGAEINVMGRRAFCPISQLDVKYLDAVEPLIDQRLDFLITRISAGGRNIIVSRRRLLERQLEETRKQFLKATRVGDLVSGTVTRTAPFGVFVEIAPGIEGLVHLSQISWSRIEKPEDVVAVGDRVETKVLALGSGEKPDSLRLSLSMKEVEGNPWDRLDSQIKAGNTLQGKVTRIAPFGAFVEIAPGVEGLVHISQMSFTKRVLKPEDVVSVGDQVAVTVKSVDPETRRIGLSIRDADGDPWLDVTSRYPVGSVVKGILAKKEPFGFFIALEPGVTGLLPKSRLMQSDEADRLMNAKPGDELQVSVATIDTAERKLSLEPGKSGTTEDWKTYQQQESGSLGSLGEKLLAALEKKK